MARTTRAGSAAQTAHDMVKKHHREVLRHTSALAAGKVPLVAAAAVNVAAPALGKEMAALGTVSECTGADTAAWRAMARLPKTHWVDAVCAAMQGQAVRMACGRPTRITMTGRPAGGSLCRGMLQGSLDSTARSASCAPTARHRLTG